MAYSQGLRVNVNKLNAQEKLLVILTIEHPFLSEPVRLVGDSQDLLFGGNTYIAMPFRIQRQSDVESELPQVSLVIQNVGRSLVKWIDSSGGGSGASIKVGLVRRSSSILEEEIKFGISSVNISTMHVSFSLVIQDNFVLKAIKWAYSNERAPGLF